ncbi:MAG: FAD-dependent oxidoreductase [Myxococcales bacterium]|nr:FAD-dependent oxidoreductase [Polyangiaceae bacterium]MDW8248333.1 FAD-dependent oxidoreductase [Myxococcales bacterium]
MRSSSVPVLILGAGLAGLSAAWHLRRQGVKCRLLERQSQVGGHAVTVEEEGYRFDRTGHLLHLRDEEIRGWIHRLLGERLLTVQRRSRVYSHGVYTRYPFQANTYGLPPEVAHECIMGFLEAQKTPPSQEPEHFEAFCLAHFGQGFSRHFMLPYNEKLWGVSPREISAAWCQRFVPIPSVEDVIAGAVGLHDRELGYNASFVYPRSGIGELAMALAAEVGEIERNRVTRWIDPERRVVGLTDEEIHYDYLISTAPLDKLGGLLQKVPGEVGAAFRKLRCTDLYYLDIALSRPILQDFHWVYVPERRFPFYRVGCYSNFSPELAPSGCASLYVELADRTLPDITKLGPEVIRGLVEMRLVDSSDAVKFLRLRYLSHAYVIFDHHYFEALGVIMPYLSARGIQSTGRYGGWNYSSMEDALRYGRAAARAVLAAPTSP